jgi:hypothetical protein
MRKVAMINPGYGKHANQIERDGGLHGKGTPAYPKNRETPHVQNDKGKASHPVDAVEITTINYRRCGGEL